jgi:hypothetical protein
MTRRPPSILSVVPTGAGLEVRWEVDSFFDDSAQPEQVLIELNGVPFAQLEGDEESVEIPQAALEALRTTSVGISVTFWWNGDPPEEQQSSVIVTLASAGTGAGSSGAVRPAVTVVGVQPRTLRAPNTITIAWRSDNYNDGNIFWGTEAAPRAFQRSIRPRGTIYHGTFTTDRPVLPKTNHVFAVEVRNTHHSPDWLRTTVVVRSAPNFASLRRFLGASGVSVPASLRAVAGPSIGLRNLMQG